MVLVFKLGIRQKEPLVVTWKKNENTHTHVILETVSENGKRALVNSVTSSSFRFRPVQEQLRQKEDDKKKCDRIGE